MKLKLIVLIFLILFVVTACTKNGGKTDENVQVSGALAPESTSAPNIVIDEVIGEKAAKEIVLALVPGADDSNIKIEKDKDGARTVYEGEIKYGGKEYDFEVDAYTGEIVSWEID